MACTSVVRSVVVLSLGAVSCLLMGRPAAGQEMIWQTTLAVPEADELALVWQPGRVVEPVQPSTPLPSDLLAESEPPVRPRPADRSSLLAARTPIIRLAGMPNMFGDSLASCGQIEAYGYSYGEPGFEPGDLRTTENGYYDYHVLADLPCAAGGATTKMADNNKALPTDRLLFNYNHYHNALHATASPTRPYSIEQFTIGAEKTLFDERCSVEVRMPFNDVFRFTTPDFRLIRREVGNLGIIYKQLLWLTSCSSVAAGLGVDAPTGSDVSGRAGYTDFHLHNDAVHLLPFVGFLRAPNDLYFYQGFLQLDIAANGNRVVFDGQELGKLNEQNLLFVDLSLGRWLWRDPCSCRFKGLAAIVEYHYTTTLQDADEITGYTFNDALVLTNLYNRMDVSNLTVGLCGEIGQTTVRVGGVFPLRDELDRFFDAEVQLSLNRRF